jgi:hypothetical protein
LVSVVEWGLPTDVELACKLNQVTTVTLVETQWNPHVLHQLDILLTQLLVEDHDIIA